MVERRGRAHAQFGYFARDAELVGEMSALQPRRCYMCCFRSQKNYPLVKHLFEAHLHERGLDCRIDECSHSFSHGSSFSSHTNRKHPNWKDKLESSGAITVGSMLSRETPEASANLPPPLDSHTLENESADCSDQVFPDDNLPVNDPRATATTDA